MGYNSLSQHCEGFLDVVEYQPGLGLHMPLTHPGQDVEEGLVVIVEDVDVDLDAGEEVESLEESLHLAGLTVLLLALNV